MMIEETRIRIIAKQKSSINNSSKEQNQTSF
jgi:hypothetical protein